MRSPGRRDARWLPTQGGHRWSLRSATGPWVDPWLLALALWGGIVAVVGFPPRFAWPLAVVAPVPMWWAVLDGRCGARYGFAWGFGFFGTLLWWVAPTVSRYGGMPLAAGVGCVGALAGYLALFPAASTALVARVARRDRAAALVVAPLAWTGFEGLRCVFLGGLPWGDLPQALWRVEGALRIAPWAGIDGARFVVVLVASGLAWTAAFPDRRRRASPWGLFPTLVGCLALGVAAWAPVPAPAPTGATGEVALVQGAIDQAVKWDRAYRKSTLDTYDRLTRAADDADLVVWPETAVPVYAQDPVPERRRLEALARSTGAALVFGAPAYVREAGGIRYRNAVFLVDSRGRYVGRYDKVHLVPFGEFVPLGRYLPFVKKLVEGAGDFTPGPGVKPLGAPGGSGVPNLGPLVCFEMIFPGLAAEHARAGARWLVVVTNDGWFGRTPGPYQHLAFGAWRAAETGLPLVRAANTGISAVFDGRGRLVGATELGARDTLRARIPVPGPGVPPGLRIRPWVWATCLALALLVLFVMLRPPRRGR